MSRTVFCQYEQRDAEGLDFVPYPSELGQRIFNNIGKQAWAAWLAHQTMLINENRLSPRTPGASRVLEGELVKFLFEKDAEKPAGFTRKPDAQVVPAAGRQPGASARAGQRRHYRASFRVFLALLHLRLAQRRQRRKRAVPSRPACGWLMKHGMCGPPVGSRTSNLVETR
jgi:Fe-S cluster biosynthesis and repair protein YggX